MPRYLVLTPVVVSDTDPTRCGHCQHYNDWTESCSAFDRPLAGNPPVRCPACVAATAGREPEASDG